MVKFKVNNHTKKLLSEHNRRVQATIAMLANARCGKNCNSPRGLVNDSGVMVNGKEIVIKHNYISDRTTESHPVPVTSKEEWATMEALHNTIQMAKDDPKNLYNRVWTLCLDKPLQFN